MTSSLLVRLRGGTVHGGPIRWQINFPASTDNFPQHLSQCERDTLIERCCELGRVAKLMSRRNIVFAPRQAAFPKKQISCHSPLTVKCKIASGCLPRFPPVALFLLRGLCDTKTPDFCVAASMGGLG